MFIELLCEHCKLFFKKLKSRMKLSKKHFCSRKCVDKNKKIFMKKEGNHRFGIKHSNEARKIKSDKIKELWKNDDFVLKIKSSLEKTRLKLNHPIGWGEKSREKRKKTFIKNNSHNFKNIELRKKIENNVYEKYGKHSWELASDKITNETIEKRRKTNLKTITRFGL